MSFTHQPVSQGTRISWCEAGFPRKGSHKGCWGPSLYQYPHMRLSCAMTRIDLIFTSYSFIITIIARDEIRVHPCDWKATALHNPISLAFLFSLHFKAAASIINILNQPKSLPYRCMIVYSKAFTFLKTCSKRSKVLVTLSEPSFNISPLRMSQAEGVK